MLRHEPGDSAARLGVRHLEVAGEDGADVARPPQRLGSGDAQLLLTHPLEQRIDRAELQHLDPRLGGEHLFGEALCSVLMERAVGAAPDPWHGGKLPVEVVLVGRQARTLAAVTLRPGHSGGWYSRIIPRSTSQSFPSTGPNWIPPINVSMPSPISASVAGPERRIALLSHPCCILPLWISAASNESSNRCPPVRSCHGSRPRWNQSRSLSLRTSLPRSERVQEALPLDGN